MWIDVPLLIISIFLMIREFFPKIEDYYRKWKRTVHIILIVGMFVLSIVNIVRTNNENQNLIDTAKETLTKIDSVYVGQVKSDSTLRQSVIEIKKVDSVLGNVKDTIQYQVKLLDSSIGKSQELVRLETLDFESKKTEFQLSNLTILPDEKDTTKYNIKGVLVNKGRKGLLLYSDVVLFISDIRGNGLEILNNDINSDESFVSFELELNTSNDVSIGSFSKKLLDVNQRGLTMVFNTIYKDLITNKTYKEPDYYRMVLPFKMGDRFRRLSPSEKELTDSILRNQNLYQRIYPKDYYR